MRDERAGITVSAYWPKAAVTVAAACMVPWPTLRGAWSLNLRCVPTQAEVESAHRERTSVLSDSVRVTCSASWSTLCIRATSPALNCTPLALQRCSRSCRSLLLHTLRVHMCGLSPFT